MLRIQKAPPRWLRRLNAGPVAVLSAVALLATAGCSPEAGTMGQSHEQYRATTLRYADFQSPSGAAPFREFADEYTRTSDTQIEFEEFWSGSLLAGTEIANGVRGGIADIGMFQSTYYPSEYPVTNWMAALASLPTTEFPLGMLASNAALSDFSLGNPDVVESFESRGLKLLFATHTLTSYNLLCTDPVTTLDEAKGKRVRSAGVVWDNEIRAVGMVPVNLPLGETYDGLQRGVVDCALGSPTTLVEYGLWDAARHYTYLPMTGLNTNYTVMNLDKWEALSLSEQQKLWDSLYPWFEGIVEHKGLKMEQRMLNEGPAEHGVQFHDPDPAFTAPLQRHQESVLEQMKSDGPLGISDPEGFVTEYAGTMKRWEAKVGELGIAGPAGQSDDVQTTFDLSPYEQIVQRDVFDKYRPE